MFTVVYFDATHYSISAIAEYSQDYMTSRMLRDIVTTVLYDVDDIDCDIARAYIFSGSDTERVKSITEFDSTKLLIMSNVLITALRHRDASSKNYIANVWIHRDTDIIDYVVSKSLNYV